MCQKPYSWKQFQPRSDSRVHLLNDGDWSQRPEKATAPCSSSLAWRIPWTEEPGGLPSMGSHRVGHDWCDLAAEPEAMCWLLPRPVSSCYLMQRPWLCGCKSPLPILSQSYSLKKKKKHLDFKISKRSTHPTQAPSCLRRPFPSPSFAIPQFRGFPQYFNWSLPRSPTYTNAYSLFLFCNTLHLAQ